ncbi:DUF262 domain-containing protein [Mycoplasmopsis gallinarum]
MSKYNSITIREAMEKIASNNYVLPAIQRKFVWKPEQIETLFDSILRNYPINSFMFWEITDIKLKQNYKFYSFIKDYADRYSEDNPDAPTRLLNTPFIAVIDGQQRLTSLYIGLNGTYRYKKPNKWWSNDEEAMPTRRLYLNISRPVESKIDNEKEFDFRFLSNEDLESLKNSSDDKWFKVSDVIDFTDLGDVNAYLIENNLQDNKFAMKTLSNLMQKINNEELINFYTEKEQDQDKVLDVFIRTNSGGTMLSFSDLLMSIASANWTKLDARQEIKVVREQIRQYGSPNFNVSQDFILKTLLVLSNVDVGFKIANFGKDNINIFEANWEKIRNSIVSSFKLLSSLGFNDTLIRAKNAVIPIAYYVLINDLSEDIVKSTYAEEDKKRISTWITLSLLKGIFGGHSDSVLRIMRDVIKKSSSKNYFPLREIIQAFKNSPDKNYSLDDEIIEGFLKEKYESSMSSLILYLLYPEVVMKSGQNIAKDHMHCKKIFTDKDKFNSIGFPVNDIEFCKNEDNWNSVLNLQLLSELENKSKGSTSLEEWASNKQIKNKEMYLDDDTSLDIKDFKLFINVRKKNIIKKIKEIVNL